MRGGFAVTLLVLVLGGCTAAPAVSCPTGADCDVQETEPGVLLVADRATNYVSRWASGAGDFLGHFIEPNNTRTNGPTALAFRDDGHAFVANFRRGEVLSYDGFSGRFNRVFFHDSFMLEEPVAIRFRNDHMFLLGNDTRNLLVLDDQGEVVKELGRSVIRYAHDFRFGPDGLVYIATSWDPKRAGMVQVWDVDRGVRVRSFGTADELDEATSLTFGPDGLLYVSDVVSERVVRFDPRTGDMIDTFVDASDGLVRPCALEFGAGADLYVISDVDVLRFHGATGELRSVFVHGESAGLVDPRSLTWRYGGVAARWLDR